MVKPAQVAGERTGVRESIGRPFLGSAPVSGAWRRVSRSRTFRLQIALGLLA